MLRVLTNLLITQVPSNSFPQRTRILYYDFCHEYESEDSWKEQTNKAKVILPKSVYIKDGNGKIVTLKGTNYNLGGFSDEVPVFLKGDKITIRAGYRYFDKQHNEVIAPQDGDGGLAIIFQGFITSVKSKT